jgi:DnaK suppressor protein
MVQANRGERRWLTRRGAGRCELEALAHSVHREGWVTVAGRSTRPLASAGELDRSLADSVSTEAMRWLLAGARVQRERAVDRLREGRYGCCEDCGRHIPEGRLRLRPTATRCVECQSWLEGRQMA